MSISNFYFHNNHWIDNSSIILNLSFNLGLSLWKATWRKDCSPILKCIIVIFVSRISPVNLETHWKLSVTIWRYAQLIKVRWTNIYIKNNSTTNNNKNTASCHVSAIITIMYHEGSIFPMIAWIYSAGNSMFKRCPRSILPPFQMSGPYRHPLASTSHLARARCSIY